MTHVYAEDPEIPYDHRGEGRCWCGRPKRNDQHKLPPAPREQREHEARYEREARHS